MNLAETKKAIEAGNSVKVLIKMPEALNERLVEYQKLYRERYGKTPTKSLVVAALAYNSPDLLKQIIKLESEIEAQAQATEF